MELQWLGSSEARKTAIDYDIDVPWLKWQIERLCRRARAELKRKKAKKFDKATLPPNDGNELSPPAEHACASEKIFLSTQKLFFFEHSFSSALFWSLRSQ